MKAFVLHGPKDMRFEKERRRGEVGPADALIRVRRTGICGSDVHYYLNGKIGEFVPREPFVLGHEFSGEIAEIGQNVVGFKAGDRVAVDPSMPCGECVDCRGGRYNLCRNMRFIGSASCYPHIDGGFGEYVAVPARNCIPLPAGLDYGFAALIEPLSVAVHAIMRTTTTGGVAGRTVVITGAGTIGYLVLLVARAYGASVVAVSDPEEFPRDAALRAGADFAFSPMDDGLKQFSEDHRVDIVVEVSGAPKALAEAIHVVRKGGTIIQVGTQPPSVELPQNLIMSKELALLGSLRSAHSVRPAIDLASSGRIDLKPVVSSIFPFSRLGEAMRIAVEKRKVIKVQVEQESGE